MQGAFIALICVFGSFMSLVEGKLHTVSLYNWVVQQRRQNYERKQNGTYFLGNFILSMEPALLNMPDFYPQSLKLREL